MLLAGAGGRTGHAALRPLPRYRDPRFGNNAFVKIAFDEGAEHCSFVFANRIPS